MMQLWELKNNQQQIIEMNQKWMSLVLEIVYLLTSNLNIPNENVNIHFLESSACAHLINKY